ncbi:ankyrin repeat domain-containing protein [Phanerochaete sordida]|uniref:Ankyrin repeat domain-containing protein n=1 Tax=Phanerochaete sordida TaxID=48140 RepID=A0A9P3GN55_9APHY|nr:ankyrin repeat domain-containing protein [Phanerochaete sordida]
MADDDTKGASNNEILIHAVREDNEDMLLELFEKGGFDINYQDGLGNTALHYAASLGSTAVLEHILSHDECDVDPINRIERATPLHLAVKLEDPELRHFVVESLLDAGADTFIKDKNGETVVDLVPDEDKETLALIRRARAQATRSQEDVVNDDDDDEPGSGSEEEEED